MKREHAPRPSGKIRQAGRWTALLSCTLAAGCFVSFYLDSKHVRQAAQNVMADARSDNEKVIAMTNWVRQNKRSRENDDYFVFRSLRATPLQVLQGGGDCADKSRLLWAMLREVGIKSTMVMCFHRQTGAPTHTVVEAQTQAGDHILVDPVYGLHFPKLTPGAYHGLLDLRADPKILDRRLGELLLTVPRDSPLRSYNPISAAYDQAGSFNWNKNALTRTTRSVLACWLGDEIYRLPRPIFLEEPKLFVAAVLIVFAAMVLIASRIASTVTTRVRAASEGIALCGR